MYQIYEDNDARADTLEEEVAKLKAELAAQSNLREEIAKIREVNASLRESDAKLKEELVTIRTSCAGQVDILTKGKDAAEAESSRLKGELANLKQSFEVKSRDLEMSYELLATSQSLLERCSGPSSER